MSNEKEKLARQWAEHAKTLKVSSPEVVAASEYILATTTPPSMADVEWDGDKHFLAGATLDTEESAEEMVMCGFTRDGEIYVVEPNPGRGKRGYWPMPGDLTPNGKKYELVEVTGDEHTETLTTVEDYEDAPEGTVVSSPGAVPAMKNRDGRWRAVGITTPLTSGSLALGAESPATVLRWGWGE